MAPAMPLIQDSAPSTTPHQSPTASTSTNSNPKPTPQQTTTTSSLRDNHTNINTNIDTHPSHTTSRNVISVFSRLSKLGFGQTPILGVTEAIDDWLVTDGEAVDDEWDFCPDAEKFLRYKRVETTWNQRARGVLLLGGEEGGKKQEMGTGKKEPETKKDLYGENAENEKVLIKQSAEPVVDIRGEIVNGNATIKDGGKNEDDTRKPKTNIPILQEKIKEGRKQRMDLRWENMREIERREMAGEDMKIQWEGFWRREEEEQRLVEEGKILRDLVGMEWEREREERNGKVKEVGF